MAVILFCAPVNSVLDCHKGTLNDVSTYILFYSVSILFYSHIKQIFIIHKQPDDSLKM